MRDFPPPQLPAHCRRENRRRKLLFAIEITCLLGLIAIIVGGAVATARLIPQATSERPQ